MDAPRPAHEPDDAIATGVEDKTRDADREARWSAWRAENADGIAALNRWYEENGHPLARYMILPCGAV
ncbi:type II toxin-antitoxin system CcdA family antitoxin [Sphingomonas sp. BIUV-7]|uniref:Type II toxin-antitoxin system CcdA family antitoxin n=1 Tax=Sphingomonas natans TaxID=3063330 RepID=A0ABT8Y669_9SPHN|nr:type II toxin-antitoxin system CcdA family antitoxin [Sphingomonas sp. BIUV-7]MDO6413816.1 type II toxin-antitoxin system CcdA family antitoxin [Sphingomonas sp. BIUV-7]